jgi:hypothetical protein
VEFHSERGVGREHEGACPKKSGEVALPAIWPALLIPVAAPGNANGGTENGLSVCAAPFS